jgi:predicted CoA-binding protein
MADQSKITEILQRAKTIAVVGLSANPGRPSFGVASYMRAQGYRIIPVNPNYSKILDEPCYPTLLAVPVAPKVDIVNIFRRSDAVLPVVEEAIRIGAETIWMQEGVINHEAATTAERAGVFVVMNRCIMRDHSRYVQKSS